MNQLGVICICVIDFVNVHVHMYIADYLRRTTSFSDTTISTMLTPPS